MRNFFEGDDFSVIAMTEAINILDSVPSRLGSMGLFQGGGISSRYVGIEEFDGELRLVPAAQVGEMPEYKTTPRRTLRAVQVPHLPKNDTVTAESVQGIREFGSENALEAVSTVVNNRLATIRQDFELTWEYHRIGALQGAVLDADASTELYNWFTEFDVSRITVNWDTTATHGLKQACIDIRRNIQTELKLRPYTDIYVMCSDGLWDQIMTSDETHDAFSRYQDSSFAREGNAQPFRYSQVNFEELRGTAGSTPFVPADEGFCFPTGTPGLYQQRFAPADFMETVNTIGRPYYAKQEPMRFNKGTEIHAQSNPLFIVTKPRVLIKLTYSA